MNLRMHVDSQIQQDSNMVPRFLLALSMALGLMNGIAAAQPLAPQVPISDGILAGTRNGDVIAYKGIPYAAAPTGDLRWRPPQPVKRWSGVRRADAYGAICEQKYNAQDNGVGPLPMSEDCLTLNVFAPTDARKLPVMFWIHGGGFVNGSSTAPLYDGSALARQGVVVVTINYRLGRFGFFAHPALTAEAKGAPVGNYGLMDIIAALKWVKANVTAFGGDPQQLTIFGESAGGVAVNDLMVSPPAQGLFARAIVQSGLGREVALPLQAAEQAGAAFAAATGLPNASAADLRGLSAQDILKAGDPDLRTGGGSMADGQILLMDPMQAFSKGLESKVPYIVGANSLELPVPAADSEKLFAGLMPAEQLERLRASYPTPESFGMHGLSDLMFNEPALALARLHSANGQATWAYQFSVLSKVASSMLKGAPHATDRQYVFQTLSASTWPTDENDAQQARTISAYWTTFAKTGDPNADGRPAWPRFDGERCLLLDFTNDGPVVGAWPRLAAMKALAKRHP